MKEWTSEWLVNQFQNVENVANVLSGIDDVPWHTLKHAYGPADDVPALLRAIFSENYAHGNFALELLFGNIWHQGTVYEATRFVPPFLIQILQSDSVFLKHKISVVHLLECMANGNSYIDVHYPSAEEYYKIYKKEEASYEAALERELRDVKSARISVLEEKESLLPLLDHSNEELACNIYLLLGRFREFSSELFPIFVERYTEENPEEVNNAILEAIRRLNLSRIENEAFFRR